MPVRAGEGRSEADENGEGGPDVGGEVDRIRLERFAVVLECDAVEVARASEVYCDREEKDEEWPDGERQREVLVEEDAAEKRVMPAATRSMLE